MTVAPMVGHDPNPLRILLKSFEKNTRYLLDDKVTSRAIDVILKKLMSIGR